MGVVMNLTNLVVLCAVACILAADGAAPPRQKVVIQGSVSCNYCVMEGGPGSTSKTALLPGAVVKLQCNNTEAVWEEKTTTDSKGNYVFRPKKVTTWGARKCKVFLVSSPRPDCPVILYTDSSGFELKSAPTQTYNSTSPSHLYTIQHLAFYPGPYMCL